MKNFSSHFLPLDQQDPNTGSQESRQEEKERKQGANGEEKARCEWNFNLAAIVSSSSAIGAVSDAIGVTEFDPSYSLLATGGIARKIRIYRTKSLLRCEGNGTAALLDHANACDYYLCTPAKLSSLRWKPGECGRVIGSADYDGVVMEYDLERRIPVFERDEHGGRRVWSMDYSHWDPIVGASGSDDGTMQIWDPRCDGGKSLAKVQPSNTGSSVCCVEFDPFGGPLLAVGCADRKIYAYDTRRMEGPLSVCDGHQKAVTYVKFLDHRTIVTSSTDGSLKMWDTENQHLIRTYRGHLNARRFVGLSVWSQEGLLCCGSESKQVFVYDKRWGEPIWVHGFEPESRGGCDRGFVSSVCWGQSGEDQCILVAGGSDGILQVFHGKRR